MAVNILVSVTNLVYFRKLTWIYFRMAESTQVHYKKQKSKDAEELLDLKQKMPDRVSGNQLMEQAHIDRSKLIPLGTPEVDNVNNTSKEFFSPQPHSHWSNLTGLSRFTLEGADSSAKDSQRSKLSQKDFVTFAKPKVIGVTTCLSATLSHQC